MIHFNLKYTNARAFTVTKKLMNNLIVRKSNLFLFLRMLLLCPHFYLLLTIVTKNLMAGLLTLSKSVHERTTVKEVWRKIGRSSA